MPPLIARPQVTGPSDPSQILTASMRARSTLPKPDSIAPWSSERRPLHPLAAPPPVLDVELPELPPPRANGSLIDEWYTLSTHLVPAAFPRSTPDIPYPVGSDFVAGETREEKRKRILNMRDAYFDPKLKHWDGKSTGHSEKQLWNCVNRYVRKDRTTTKGAKHLTLFLAHANGFPKEIYEPVLKYLCLGAKADDAVFDEIWAWEAVNHGSSAVVNDTNLCPLYDWSDNTRDMLNFMIHYLPDSMDDSPASHMTPVGHGIAKDRQKRGFTQRTLICVGHSFGGNTLIRAAYECPALFSALMTIDPVIKPPPLNISWISQGDKSEYLNSLVEGALARRDTWSSREEALKLFQRNPFFASWAPEVLAIYIECGLGDRNDGRVTLKMSGLLEAAVFVECRATFEVWDYLPEVDDRIELRYLLPEMSDDVRSEKQQQIWLRPNNASNTIITGTGHLIPHEAPEDVAYEIHALAQKYQSPNSRL